MNGRETIIAKCLELILKNGLKNLCDYGCGNGRMLRDIAKYAGIPLDLTGIDYARRFEDTSGERSEPEMRFIDRDSMEYQQLLSRSDFDLILSTWALHHFRFPVSEIQALFSMLKRNGYFLLADISFKNDNDSQTMKNICGFADEMLEAFRGNYHRHHYTLDEAKDILKVLDAEIVEAFEGKEDVEEEQRREEKEEVSEKMKSKTDAMVRAEDREIVRDLIREVMIMAQKLLGKYLIEHSTYFMIIGKKN